MPDRTAQPTWRFVLVLAFVCALVLTGCGAPAANTSNASSSSEPAKEQAATTSTTDGEWLGVWHEQQVVQQFKSDKGGLTILRVFMLRLEIGLVFQGQMGQQTVS